jgi:hypothetical protein
MEQINSENFAEHQFTSEEIINSPLVIKKLQQHSLKEVLAKYSDSTVANQTNLIERAAKVGNKNTNRSEFTPGVSNDLCCLSDE